MKVCLDAGHYGHYYNRSPVVPTYYESEMNWKLHNYLTAELEARGVEVVQTRTNQEQDRELVDRGYAARGCSLFLSLHSNAASAESANHVSGIHMRENSVETYDEKSKDIAEKLAKKVASVMGCDWRIYSRSYNGDRDGNGRQDDEYYGVLQGAKQARVPGVILEHGFHTNKAQALWLSNNENLKKLAKAEAEVIADWVGAKAPTPTPTPAPASTAVATKYNGTYTKSVSGSGYSSYGPASSYSCVWKTTDELNLRDKADPYSKVLINMKKGSTVRSWGFYSYYNGARWFCVETTYNKVKYTGYCNASYLTKA